MAVQSSHCMHTACRPTRPFISDDKAAITRLIYDALEAHVPYPEVWATVHGDRPARIKGGRTVSQLVDAHDSHNGFQWDELYPVGV